MQCHGGFIPTFQTSDGREQQNSTRPSELAVAGSNSAVRTARYSTVSSRKSFTRPKALAALKSPGAFVFENGRMLRIGWARILTSGYFRPARKSCGCATYALQPLAVATPRL